MDLSVQIGSLTLKNPLIAASGCFGYGVEYADIVDLASLGGVAVKGLFLAEREGHPAPRIVETPAGMLNAIGLQGIGVHRFIDEKLPELRARGATVIVNICGTTLDEYVEVARILSDAEGVAAIELNISCPNIKEGGITFGCSLTGTFEVVSAVRKVTRLPIIPKLTPNVTDVASFARASEDAGADAVSLVNTFLAMVIDVESRRPKISNIVGGLSGPAIRPIAVRMVYECRQTVKIPIIGMGGIADAQGRARVHHCRRGGRPGGHGELRRSVHLAEAARRHHRLHGAASDRAHRRSGRHGGHPDQGQGMDQLLVALDVDTAAEARALADTLRGLGRRIQDRQPSVHQPRAVDRRRARRARRPRFSRSEVSRHSEYGAGAVAAATRLGAWMVNVHASGGAAMMRAAREAADDEASRRSASTPARSSRSRC